MYSSFCLRVHADRPFFRPSETEEHTEGIAEVDIDQTPEQVLAESVEKISKLTGLRVLED